MSTATSFQAPLPDRDPYKLGRRTGGGGHGHGGGGDPATGHGAGGPGL